ncbi:lysine-2,3-aminomutase-like protein [Methylovirgula sp. 4M-Z18]|uniref:lysine-2,3-aminomutase-like protein n=1 Tax=Methylovirgula sp. 4M-Z18 TaxID=2293567 RepID=UPI000E2F6356|nr:lysine-2,3-aminomutase-like protein [Methylovirgula sp. 4M-Z18]RFB80151.1 lysine-2,3-aminomutase-like protein [Methylovirgula sp. 4M-Z18]
MKTLRTLDDLLSAGLLTDAQAAGADVVMDRYAVAVTPDMTALIDRHAPDDPIAKQFVPSPAELRHRSEERADPIGDNAHSPLPGLVHRYPDRVLLKVVAACPVYCRFCFRREMVGPGKEPMLEDEALDAALAYVAAHADIHEVILTGGDPLILTARRLHRLMTKLAAQPHVEVVRIHSRVPVVAPDRITPALVDALKAAKKAVFVAVHANHPRELTPAARAALARLADAGIPLVSQTVLLKGVNDDAETLAALMRGFIANRVKPYYLHQGDLAPGTSHFRTTIATGQALMRALQGRLSGLAMPTYVLDIPGGHGKSPIGPGYVSDYAVGADGAERFRIADFHGEMHVYPPRQGDR